MPVVRQVGLVGIENILKLGEALGGELRYINEYAGFVEEAGGKDKLETLQVRLSYFRSA